MESSARLLELLSLLQARRDWPGADLAERLGGRGGLVHRVAHALQGDPEGAPDVRLVVDDEDTHGDGSARG